MIDDHLQAIDQAVAANDFDSFRSLVRGLIWRACTYTKRQSISRFGYLRLHGTGAAHWQRAIEPFNQPTEEGGLSYAARLMSGKEATDDERRERPTQIDHRFALD